MKKGANVSKSPTISSSVRSMKFHRNVDSSCNRKIPKVSSSSSSSSSLSSTILNRRAKSSQDLDISRSKSSSSTVCKLSLERKSSLDNSLPSYNVDELTSRQMHDSLLRLKKNTIQPFTFLNNILDEKTLKDHYPIERTKPTEIDLQLAALTRRVQLNKSLLERTNERVKEIHFLVERNAMTASRELNYDIDESEHAKASGDDVTDPESALNIACPGIMELKRTINVTREMLTYVKKICNNEIGMKDLPEKLSKHMSTR